MKASIGKRPGPATTVIPLRGACRATFARLAAMRAAGRYLAPGLASRGALPEGRRPQAPTSPCSGALGTAAPDTKEKIRMNISVRNERVEDIEAISGLTEAAFRHEEHSSHTEQFIVNALRRAGCLTISLVAEEGGAIVGHVAISPVTLSSGTTGWYGLGPISVCPERQGQGIGSTLMRTALAELQRLGGAGCVVLGDPGYYARFGFEVRPGLTLPGVAPEYFQALAFAGEYPTGSVSYHESFDATQ